MSRRPTPPIKVDPKGKPFVDLVYDRAARGRKPRAARDVATRVTAFIQGWSWATDHLGHEPSVPEFAEAFKEHVPNAYRDLELFKELFPTESNPTRIVDALWDARTSWGSLMAERVTATDEL